MDPARIVGRSSSHLTRVTRIFAHEVGVPVELEPIYDLTEIDPATYAGTPALEIPSLRHADALGEAAAR